MISYELALLIRSLPKVELTCILKRTANKIFENGGIIRRIDNLGCRPLPYKIRSHSGVEKEANYFIMEFIVPPTKLTDLTNEYNRDIDIIRNRIYKMPENDTQECSLEEELKPAPYRSAVIKLIEEARKKESRKKHKFEYNTGLDYYPFQK